MVETVVKCILESLPWIERSLSIVTRDRRLFWRRQVNRRRRGGVYRRRRWGVYRRRRGGVYRRAVEVSAVSRGGGGGLHISV